jgi:RNA polymerase sigma factor (sigma-70 family)
MPPPPPAEGFASRIFLGPALRTQPDRRLVSLVRQGYELAFEEIVRRYDKALGRYAAAIVPRHRAEDVTQDAFSKALLALRDTEAEIELRPWLYRIVRNTALNDLRDQPAAEALDETLAHLHTAHEEAVRREELRDLMTRLRALPEPQRAAIVMRELEGLSHEEIAAALGLSGGGARQAIYRARRALREGAGLLIPMPFLKALLTGGAVADAGAAGAGAAGAGGAALAGGSAGGGAAITLKAAAATVLVAGTVGTGVALQEQGDAGPVGTAKAESSQTAPEGSAEGPSGAPLAAGDNRGPGGGAGSSGGDDRSTSSGPGGGGDGGSSGPGSDDGSGSASLGGEDHSGSSGSSGSGISGGGGDSGDSGSGSSSSGPGSGGSGDTSGGSSNSGPGGGGGDTTSTTTSPAAPQPIELESPNSGSGSSGSDSRDGGSTSSDSGSSGSDDGSLELPG